MKLDKILDIAVNIRRIKGLTDNEYIIEAVDNIRDIIQEEINLEEENKKNEPVFTEAQKTLLCRDFNYYFNEGDEVMFDPIETEYFNFKTFKTETLIPYHGKKGVVTSCYSDFHAFGRGSSYMCKVKIEDVEFHLMAGYFIPYENYKKENNESDSCA